MLQANFNLRTNASLVAVGRLAGKLLKTPSALALLVQSAALLIVLGCGSQIDVSVYTALNIEVGFVVALVLLQATLASLISCLIGMAVWWRWIHFFFPILLWVMSKYPLSNTFYLVGFIISLTLYWTTFKTQVPFYPSRPAVWQALQQLMQLHPHSKQGLRMVDIGSGLGDMSMYIAKSRRQDQVEGIEIAPLPWLISYLRGHFKQSTATFTLGNYQTLDFANYDVVFAYLSPAAMPQLWQKASKEMRSGSLLVSLEFPIPEQTPSQVIPLKSSPTLYIWRMTNKH